MKRVSIWPFTLGAALIALTAFFYYIHFLIFRDLHHIFIYFIGDVAFVFFEVLLVTLIIHRLLHHREKKSLYEKLNMLIAAFFSELGTELLRKFSGFDPGSGDLARQLNVVQDWSEKEFLDIRENAAERAGVIDPREEDLEDIRDYLKDKKQFLLDCLQNPNLQENKPFTNLVWSMFHLTEELIHTKDLKNISQEHRHLLILNIKKVYKLLIAQWAEYMDHLRLDYPYLFSLKSGHNPFGGGGSVEVK